MEDYIIDSVINSSYSNDSVTNYTWLSNINTYSTGETATKGETKKVAATSVLRSDGYYDVENNQFGIVKVKNKMIRPVRVIFNAPATIVFWDDGTKTVVKCSDDDEFSEYEGFCAACTKKLLGNNSKIKKLISKLKA